MKVDHLGNNVKEDKVDVPHSVVGWDFFASRVSAVEDVEELMKAKDENEELISKNNLLEDQVDDLNYQIKKLKKVKNLRKSHWA